MKPPSMIEYRNFPIPEGALTGKRFMPNYFSTFFWSFPHWDNYLF